MLLYQTSTRLKFGMEKRVYEKYKKSRWIRYDVRILW
jgi:hypothetical protein